MRKSKHRKLSNPNLSANSKRSIFETRNVFKKDKRRRIKKKEKKVLVHKSYKDDGKLRMIIVKDQWTAILANFVRK